METYREILESITNAIGARDREIKEKYKDQVWDVLEKSYKSIGGIKGSGFKNKDEMVDKIPFWKMNIVNGEVIAVVMYKDKGGRKFVASGTNQTPEGKIKLIKMVEEDMKRSYGEKSKASLGLLMGIMNWNILKHFTHKPSKDVIALKDVPKKDWPDDAVFTIKKYPQLIDYGYLRKINDQLMFKVMFGTPNKKIT